MRSRRGLTIVELMFVLTVGSLVFLLVLVSFHNLSESTSKTVELATLDQESARLGELLSQELEGIGGDILSPRMSVFVENNVDESGSDRITKLSADTDFLPCGIEDINELGFVSVSLDTLTETCCIDDTALAHQALLVSADQRYWRSVEIERVSEAPQCIVSLSTTGLEASDVIDSSAGMTVRFDQPPSSDEAFIGGALVIVDIERFFLDSDTEQLFKERPSEPRDGTLRQSTMGRYVQDFQVSLGFDTRPPDGVYTDNDDASDEWLYNHDDDDLADILGCAILDDACAASGVPQALQLQFTMARELSDGSIEPDEQDDTGAADAAVVSRVSSLQVFFRNQVFFE